LDLEISQTEDGEILYTHFMSHTFLSRNTTEKERPKERSVEIVT